MRIFYRIVPLLVTLLAFTLSAIAQNAAEIEAAKSMARSYGYSESEINAIINKQKENASSIATTIPEVERVVTVQDNGDESLMKEIERKEPKRTLSKIYGHGIFKSPSLNFVPSYNMPTPANYKLAPGDELVIDLWGASVMNISQAISPEGSITIPDIGPVYLTGMTVSNAERVLKSRLAAIYSGLTSSEPNTFMRLSLGRIRSFSVNVVGDAERPGTYTLPSLSTVFSALYLAGGPTEIGSVRNIKVFRNNKLVKVFDVYDFIMDGDFSANLRLEDDDLIKIEPFTNHVVINGKIKRPLIYEMKDGETVKDIIEYAGGFAKDANPSFVHIVRIKGERKESFDVQSKYFSKFTLIDGDSLFVNSNIDDNKNSVSISGAVWIPGTYAISDTLNTLQKLIKIAGGVRDGAYMDRGYIERLNEKRDMIAINFSVNNVLNGTEEVMLKNDDIVRIFANNELAMRTQIYTNGALNRPDTLAYREGMTLGDAILLSGGFSIGATLTNIDVARRNQSMDSNIHSEVTAKVYTFNLLEDTTSVNFKLMPFDMVFVRNAPNYKKQQSVTIIGEVLFPGEYVVERNAVRLSEVVKKAGGFNNNAYVDGCILERKLTDEERKRALAAIEIAKNKLEDTTTFQAIDVNSIYTVGINMKEAIKNPGSYADVVLRTGDVIRVPQMNNTVRISGGVLYQNVVAYDPNMSVSDYIAQAGGYVKDARRGQKYIIYMNGMVATSASKGGLKPAPGCEIVVPIKDQRDKRRITTAEIMSIATSTTSIATMAVSMVNILSRSKTTN